MTDTYTPLLRFTLQETDTNPDTWGEILNAGVFQLIEDAIAGMASISLAAADDAPDVANGGSDEQRKAIINLTGALPAARTLTVPATTKLYLIINSTTGGHTVTAKVSGQTGVVIPAATAKFVYCDGTDVREVYAAASSATTAATATNALSLGGVAAASYARLDQTQLFVGAQNVTKVTLTDSAGIVAVDATLSNSFRLTMDGDHTLANPTGGVDGQIIRIVIEQGSGGTHVINWGSKYAFPGGVNPTLSTVAGDIDYASFEYDADSDLWLGGLANAFAP